MSDRVRPSFALECKHCKHRWPGDATAEAMLLHFQVDHDTDDVEVDLVVVCTCAATMTFVEARPTGGGTREHYTCPACGNDAVVGRRG